jgi:photosystem II stability/assembly factor-like uncharacterized protein
MVKRKEQPRRKHQQKTTSVWLIAVGLILIMVFGLWIILSKGQSGNADALPISQLTTNDFHSLAFSAVDPETIFFGHHDGLLISKNGGKEWASSTLKNVDAMALALPSSNPKVMYAAGHDIFFKSNDGGETWESIPTNLPGSDIHGFAVDPDDDMKVYAHIVGYGLYGSQDGGYTWKLLSENIPPSTFNLVVGKDAQSLYTAAGDAGLWQSLDAGKTWSAIQTIPDHGAIAVTYSRLNGRLYVTTIGNLAGLYASDDDSNSWTSLGLNGTWLAVAVSPLDQDHIVTVSDQGQVFASRDGGRSWKDQ